MNALFKAAGAVLLGLVTVAHAWAAPDAASEAAMQAARSLGPWPVTRQPDSTNPMSGRPRAIQFGERLFIELKLSGDQRGACSSCHDPRRSLTDGRERGYLGVRLDDNTASLNNLAGLSHYGRDGRYRSLWEASRAAIVDPGKLAGNAATIATEVRRDTSLFSDYAAATGRSPTDDDDATILLNLGRGLAAWIETQRTPRTRFDAWRDAALGASGDTSYPGGALRGLEVFAGPGRCTSCHAGPALSADRLERLPGDRPDAKARRVPTLRGLVATAPYLHDGSAPTIAAAIERHRLDTNPASGSPSGLSATQIDDLVRFLETLSE